MASRLQMAAAVFALANAVAAMPAPAAVAAPEVTSDTLLDRIKVEDLLASYYRNFGRSSAAFENYFTQDAVFDGAGRVFKGREAIGALYRGMRNGSLETSGIFHMTMSSPVIAVYGDYATAEFIWSGYANAGTREPPRMVEQGREYDLLVKQNGKWLIKKRVVFSDSGPTANLSEGYDPRIDYDILKDQ